MAALQPAQQRVGPQRQPSVGDRTGVERLHLVADARDGDRAAAARHGARPRATAGSASAARAARRPAAAGRRGASRSPRRGGRRRAAARSGAPADDVPLESRQQAARVVGAADEQARPFLHQRLHHAHAEPRVAQLRQAVPVEDLENSTRSSPTRYGRAIAHFHREHLAVAHRRARPGASATLS